VTNGNRKDSKKTSGPPLGKPNAHAGGQLDGRAKATANEHLTQQDGPVHKQPAARTPVHTGRQNDGTVPGQHDKPRKEVKDAHGKDLNDWTEPPPTPVLFQTTLPVSVTGGATTLFTWSPLTIGDELEDLFLLLQTVSTTATAETITVALYASDNPITSVAAAQASTPIVPAIVVPGDAEGVSSTNNVFTFRALIPLLYRCSIQGRYLALVVTAGADAIAGYVSVVPRRYMRWYYPWGAPPTTAG